MSRRCYHAKKAEPRPVRSKRMQSRIIQIAGLAFTIAYAVFIVWIYATEPRTFDEMATSAEVAAGTYK